MLNPRRQLDSLLASHALASKQCVREVEALASAESRVKTIEESRSLLQAVAETVQRQAHERIADLVTRCLRSVFEEDSYEFRIKFSQKRGRTEAELLFVRDGVEIDPTTAAGGGVVDVAALGLRIACLILSRPKRRRLLLLDEPLRFLSREYVSAARELLQVLSKELDLQMVVITHARGLMVGKVVEVKHD